MGSESVKKIATLLQAPDARSRRQAIIALEKSNHPEAIKYLNWAVRNETDEELRQLASQAVRSIRQQQVGKDRDAETPTQREYPSPENPISTNIWLEQQVNQPRKINDAQTLQDSLLLGVCVFLLGASLLFSLSSAHLIRMDRVLVTEGGTFATYIHEVKAVFLSFEYPNPEMAINHIERLDGRLHMGDITRFYNGQNTLGRILIKSDDILWPTYVNYPEYFPEWLASSYKGDDVSKRDLMVYFLMGNFGIVFLAITPVLGLSKSSRSLLFRGLRAVVIALGMRVFWTVLFVGCVIELVLLGLIYTQVIEEFVRDFITSSNLQVVNLNLQNLVDWQFFLIFALWGIGGTIALASILFRPYQKLETAELTN
jgi:hypothetical protein